MYRNFLAVLGFALFSLPLSAQADLVVVEVEPQADAAMVNYIDFGQVELYDSRFRGLRLINDGDSDVVGLELTLRGYDFYGRTDCRDVLPAGEECRVRLEFRPRTRGSHYGDLYIEAVDVYKRIDLRGWGIRRR